MRSPNLVKKTLMVLLKAGVYGDQAVKTEELYDLEKDPDQLVKNTLQILSMKRYYTKHLMI